MADHGTKASHVQMNINAGELIASSDAEPAKPLLPVLAIREPDEGSDTPGFPISNTAAPVPRYNASVSFPRRSAPPRYRHSAPLSDPLKSRYRRPKCALRSWNRRVLVKQIYAGFLMRWPTWRRVIHDQERSAQSASPSRPGFAHK